MRKNKKDSQNKLFNDFNAESDDFVLADLQTVESEQEPSPAPLSTVHDDEVTINNLFMSSEEIKEDGDDDEQVLLNGALFIGDDDEDDNFSSFDRFMIGPVEHDEELDVNDPFDGNNANLKFDDISDDEKSEEIRVEPSFSRARVSANKRANKAPILDDADQVRSFNQFNAESDDFVPAALHTTAPEQAFSPVPLTAVHDDETLSDDFVYADLHTTVPEQAFSPIPLTAVHDDETLSDDFVPADLHTIAPEQTFSPVPLTTVNDDEAIDSLLVNLSINPKEDGDQETLSDDVFFAKENAVKEDDVADDVWAFERFVIEPIEHEEEQAVDINNSFDSQNAKLKFQSIPEELQFEDRKSEKIRPEPSVRKIRVSINKKQDKVPTHDFDKVKPSFFGIDYEINTPSVSRSKNDKKTDQSEDYIKKDYGKKATPFNYVTIGISSAALLLGMFVTYQILHLESQISKLSNITTILEEDLSELAEKDSNSEPSNLGSSNLKDMEQVNTNYVVSPDEQLKINERSVVSDDKVEGSASAETQQELPATAFETSVKTKVEQTELQDNVSGLPLSLNEHKKNGKTLLMANKNLSGSRPRKVSRHEVQKTNKKRALRKRKLVKPLLVASQLSKPKGMPSSPEWVVSLIAYNDERFARRRAARLINRGIPVKVDPIHANRAKWYLLKVGGFKNRENAASYASKIKKSLRLRNVEVRLK